MLAEILLMLSFLYKLTRQRYRAVSYHADLLGTLQYFNKVYVMNIFEFTRYTVGTHYPVPVRICMTSGRPDIRISRKTNIRVFLFTYKK